jgi:allantoate deiminase
MRDAGIEVNSLASGAGHDAMAMAGFTPMGMLFVRCKEGISHHPDESITTNDAAVALDVLTRAVCADADVAAPI